MTILTHVCVVYIDWHLKESKKTIKKKNKKKLMVQKIVSKEKKRKEYEKRFFILECSSNLPPDL